MLGHPPAPGIQNFNLKTSMFVIVYYVSLTLLYPMFFFSFLFLFLAWIRALIVSSSKCVAYHQQPLRAPIFPWLPILHHGRHLIVFTLPILSDGCSLQC